jgi:hypothetical protein
LTIGIEQATRYAGGHEDVIIASVETLAAGGSRRLRHLADIPWAAIVADEAHHFVAKSFYTTLQQLGCFHSWGPPLIGFTATPTGRSDGVGLGHVFEAIAYQKSLQEMIADHWLSPIRAWSIATNTDLDRVATRQGDFVERELADVINTPQRNALIVEAWRRLAEDRRTLIFAVNVLHAEAIALSFQQAGISAQSLTGQLRPEIRHTRLADFQAGRIQVLSSVSILTEGYDDPTLSCLLIARPTQSALLFAQMIGRVTRIAPHKSDALVLDLLDTSNRHTIQTVAGLFGLPPRLNLQGRNAAHAAQQIEATLGSHPALRADQFASAQDLLEEARRIDLHVTPISLTGTIAPEVTAEASLAWARLPSHEYYLPLANQTGIRIRCNLLHQWEIYTTPDQTVLGSYATRQAAFAAAEDEIARRDPQRFRFARQHANWRSRPPTDAQRQRLLTNGLHIPATSGEASHLIDHLIARRRQWQDEPATRKQYQFLKYRGLWREGMTKGEANTVIVRIKAEEASQTAS